MLPLCCATSHTLRQEFSTKYWKERYQLREKNILWCLSDCRDRVLNTGKYLNVIR
ncbi:unnamed protein product [Discosporangium mesarthrocarpum]